MKIIEKNDGQKIAYEASGNKLTLGDDEMTLNLSRYERDDPAHIDVCRDKFGCLVCGVIPGVTEPTMKREPVPFDIDKCTLTLWTV